MWTTIALVVGLLAGCSGGDDPQWQLSLAATSASATADAITLSDPDAWAVAVTHTPKRMGAVLSTQRLVSEWSDLLRTDEATASVDGTEVVVGIPDVEETGLTFPLRGEAPPSLSPASLVLDYDRPLRYSFDLASTAGWTYVVTFGPGRSEQDSITVQQASSATVAFEADRARTLSTSEALRWFSGSAYLVLLDNRTYSVVPVALRAATLEGTTLTLQTQNSAPPVAFNRGALFVDGLPTPA